MFKFFLPLLILFSFQTYSQIFPNEGSRLHYRIVGFTFPAKGECTLEIAAGNYSDEASFKKKTIISKVCSEGRVIAEVPSFGSEYTWRVEGVAEIAGEMHHFSTLTSPLVDTTFNRMRITSNLGKYKDKYFFVDVAEALYDIQGKPVWFLPDIPLIANKRGMIRDLKITPQYTITFLANNKIFEINYNGDILWQGPDKGEVSGEKEEFYHHEFTRLGNGHYMVMGAENVPWEVPSSDDTAYLKRASDVFRDSGDKYYRKIPFGTLIEYDNQGHVVWFWKTSAFAKAYGLYLLQTFGKRESLTGGHENSFFFDEKENVIYMGYRDISTIVKIKYPEGQILAVYKSISTNGEELFYGQHSIKLSGDRQLLVFNNNAHSNTEIPKVVVLQEDNEYGQNLKKIWEYQPGADVIHADKEQSTKKAEGKVKMTSGGNFMELNTETFFVSMNILYENKPFSIFFMVNNNKKILWNALYESRASVNEKWKSKINYRAFMISDEKMSSLILRY